MASAPKLTASPFANVGGTLAVTNSSFPNGTVGTSYPFQTLTASGGTPPYFFSINGTLPPGLNLNSGFISGTPTTAGTFPFNVVVTDTSETNTAQRALSITITPGRRIRHHHHHHALPNGTVSIRPTTAGLACTNCSGYTWSVSGGSLPSGPFLEPHHRSRSRGRQNQAGINPFLSRAHECSRLVAALSPRIFPSRFKAPRRLPSISKLFRPRFKTWPTRRPSPPPEAQLLTHGLFHGTANGGVTINATTGVISGTPPTQGQFTLNVLLTDSVGGTATRVFILTVSAGLTILTSSSLPQWSRWHCLPRPEPVCRWRPASPIAGRSPPEACLLA